MKKTKRTIHLFFARCLAKLIDVCIIYGVMVLMIIAYTVYAFYKIKKYVIKVYVQAEQSLGTSKEIIEERTMHLEDVKGFWDLYQVLSGYATFDVLVNLYGLIFLGGYVTLLFISIFIFEVLFVNKKGQTIGKRLMGLQLTRKPKWWELIIRSVLIHFVQWFLALTYILPIRKKFAMAHEHLFNNYVVFEPEMRKENQNGETTADTKGNTTK